MWLLYLFTLTSRTAAVLSAVLSVASLNLFHPCGTVLFTDASSAISHPIFYSLVFTYGDSHSFGVPSSQGGTFSSPTNQRPAVPAAAHGAAAAVRDGAGAEPGPPRGGGERERHVPGAAQEHRTPGRPRDRAACWLSRAGDTPV